MSIRPKCSECQWWHSVADARVLGRFTLAPLFQATYLDAPIRTTRAEAEADMCTHRKEIRS